tara:strand:- start:5598 stop:6821 length:1224 start_codon:yes stop_codon:yes gene_type:complete
MSLNNDKASKLREDFPIFLSERDGKPLVYLDNAATTQKPSFVIDSIAMYYERENSNIHRGVYQLSENATKKYEQSHKLAADLINSKKEEMIFTKNTTESLNVLAYSLGSYVKGKEIVLTELEHHSNLVPWQQLAKRNKMKLKFIPVKKDLTLDYAAAEKLITEDTAIVSMNHISNAVGTINDVKRIINLAKEKNAISIIDGAQSVPHMELDVKSLGCDFLAFSSHKMLGPTGIGCLFGNKKILEEMDPFNFGGDMIKTVSYKGATWADLPWKFEAGTPNIAGGVVFGEAIKYLQKVGLDNIAQWEKTLLTYTLERLKEIKGIQLFNPGIDHSAGIVSFNMDGIHTHDVTSLLDDDHICLRGGHHCAMPLMNKLGIAGTSRASFYFYNTIGDIDKFITSLKKIRGVFK